jgi:hypothetical protein
VRGAAFLHDEPGFKGGIIRQKKNDNGIFYNRSNFASSNTITIHATAWQLLQPELLPSHDRTYHRNRSTLS